MFLANNMLSLDPCFGRDYLHLSLRSSKVSMAIINLSDLLALDHEDRFEINLRAAQVWDSQPCGMEVVNAVSQVKKIDELMALRRIDCPEIYDRMDQVKIKGKKVLELGCGTGIDSRELINRGALLTSIDFSKVSCKLAHEFLSEVFPNQAIYIMHSSIHDTGLPSESFDIIYSHGSIHHSSLFPEICKEINRLLKPNGKALVMVYRKPSLMYIHAKMGRLIDYNAPVSLFLSDREFQDAMNPMKETWRKNYYFARPHVTRLGKFIPATVERWIGKFYGACQLVEFEKTN